MQSRIPIRLVDKRGEVTVFFSPLKAKKYLAKPNISLLKQLVNPQILRLGEHELAAILPIKGEYIILGPVLITYSGNIPSIYEMALAKNAIEDNVDIREVIPLVSPSKLCDYLRMLSLMFLHKDINVTEILEKCMNLTPKYTTREFIKARFDGIEKGVFDSLSFREEKELLEWVKAGDVKKVSGFNINGEKYSLGGLMSQNLLRNYKYMAVSVATIIGLTASSVGVPDADIYVITGTYMQKIDYSESPEQIFSIIKALMIDFTERIAKINSQSRYTKTVQIAINYIKSHTHKRITVTDIAEHTGVSKDRIYREFVNQIGMSPSNYIQKEKVEEAKGLLENTSYSSTEIAAFLDFCSQSHFIDTFKKYAGCTPKEYRSKN